ncbi:MAG: FeoB-associated Cys-rich membrane protein [Oscillospiraceae bacterium]|jgi:cbb3-type cytochrome oxidase subunit 3|nr:FeoB-associated Cys-rich membrane protein [Oscillospiraceae bacterium]
MLEFLSDNIGTIVTGLLVLVIIIFAFREVKKGGCSEACGGDCACCKMKPTDTEE